MTEDAGQERWVSWTERMSARDRLEETRIRIVIESLLFPAVIGAVWMLVGGAYLVGPLDASADPGRFRLIMGVMVGLTVLLLGLRWKNLRELRQREKALLAQKESGEA